MAHTFHCIGVSETCISAFYCNWKFNILQNKSWVLWEDAESVILRVKWMTLKLVVSAAKCTQKRIGHS